MIRSIPVNLFGTLLGLGILCVGFMYLTEDVGDLGLSGLISPHALFVGSFNIALGLWAFLGSVKNLKNRNKVPKQPLTQAERFAAVILVLFLGGISALIVLYNVPRNPIIESISRFIAFTTLFCLPLALLVGIWSAISSRIAK